MVSDDTYAIVRGDRVVGFLLYLASDAVLFATFIFAYAYLRSQSIAWPPPGIVAPDRELAAANSIVLFSSGITMHAALRSLRAERKSRALMLAATTMVLGALFLAGQLYEYSQINDTWNGTAFGAAFFSLTGLHGIHVLAGIIFIGIVSVQYARGVYDARHDFGFTAATLFWHLVDVAWIVLFSLIYVVR